MLKSLTSEQPAVAAEVGNDDVVPLLSALLDVSCFCLEQPLSNDGQNSAIMVILASLYIVKPDNWLQPTEVAPLITALLYCSRLFSVLIHLAERKLWDSITRTLTPRNRLLHPSSEAPSILQSVLSSVRRADQQPFTHADLQAALTPLINRNKDSITTTE